jgi:hypothetical protein
MTNEITTKDEDAVDAQTDAYLRAEAIVDAINANLPTGLNGLPKIPKDYVFRKRDRQSVALAFHAAFELIGGVPALMQWAAQNPDKFYPLYQKFALADIDVGGGNTFVFQTAVPTNALDLVSINDKGQVIEVDAEDDLPE